MLQQAPRAVSMVVERIRRAGGQGLLVGGSVVDMLQGQTPKDWDIEIYGLGYDRIVSLFSDCQPKTVGKAFGIVKIIVGDLDLDLSIPRRENKVGVGHKGFEVSFDPTMTVKEAARRRDFTINAMALDLSTGQLHDPFGGQRDLAAGILRVTDPQTFVEDPLRALRAMQILARKLKSVDPGTLFLIQSMRGTFGELPKERVLEEFRKLFLKAKYPSIGLQFLHDSRWIEHFPELQALVGLEQHPEWHPEGDVWTHSKMAADEFAAIRHKIPEQDREAMAYGVFLHDLGKAGTTVLPRHVREGTAPAERLYTAYGHDKAGRTPAQSFLKRIGASERTTALSTAVVEEHMQPFNLLQGEAAGSAYLRLAKRMQAAGGDLTHLGYMSHCDACATGKPHRHPDQWGSAASTRMFDEAERIARTPSLTEPRIQGRHLVSLGVKPGPSFAPALRAAFEAQLEHPEWTDAQLLAVAIAALPPGAVRAAPNPGYPWLSLPVTEAAARAAASRGVSAVARAPGGFLPAYRKAGGVPARMQTLRHSSGQSWSSRRDGFIARHMAQADVLWEWVGGEERPTRRHLALAVWAYSPDPGRLRRWLSKR